MTHKKPLKSIFARINVPILHELMDSMQEAGHSQDEIVDQIVDLVDSILPFGNMGAVGQAIDAADGPIIKALVKLILHTRKKGA
jgi:hypothetical protein